MRIYDPHDDHERRAVQGSWTFLAVLTVALIVLSFLFR